MLPACSGRGRWPARTYRFAVVLLLVCLGFGAVAADGFSAWTKTQMWSNDCQIRGLQWVAGHGWFAAGSGAFDDGGEFPSVHGLVLQSGTGASGWGDNLFLVPDPWDPGGGLVRGDSMAGVAGHGTTLLVVGPDAVYTRNLTTGDWTRAKGLVDFGGGPVLDEYFAWGGGAVWGNNRFVLTDALCLDWSSPATWTSPTGAEWTAGNFNSPALPANASWEWDYPAGFPICYSGSRYVAVSSFGWIITSTDGNNWQTGREARGNRRTLRSVAVKDGVFVAVGDGSTVLRSTNGTTWTQCRIPATVDLKSIAAGDRWFMAVGDYEVVLISADGETWQSADVPGGGPHPLNYSAVGFGNDRFIIATHDGHSLLSGPEPLPIGISVSPAGAGVARIADRGVFAMGPGEVLDVTAVANPGYQFNGWTGDIVQSDAHLTTTVNEPLALLATFVPVTPLRVAFRAGPSLGESRMGHRTLMLADGSPVAIGGHTTGFTRSDTMDAGTPTVSDFSLAQMPATADGAAVAKLADGQFLVAGGASGSLGMAPGVDTAMLLGTTVRGMTMTELPVQMAHPRMNCAAGRLGDGRVLIAGGWFDLDSATYGELFTPATTRGPASFVATGALSSPRSHPLVIPTADGGAVVAGGHAPNGADVTRLEAYDPAANTFSVLSETLLGDGEPWILNTALPGDVRRQQRSDGSYVFWAHHAETLEGAIFLFDSGARSFTKLPVAPAIGAISRQAFMPVVDATETRAILLIGVYDDAQAESRFLVHVISLLTGKSSSTVTPLTVAGYFPAGATVTGFVQDGRTHLLLAGGCSEVGLKQNFHPVGRTFIFDALLVERLNVGEAACISTDPQAMREQSDNVHMVRGDGGALYVTYSRAARSLGGAGWFTFARRRDASGSWRREVRTERFPDSSTANSIVVDGAGRVHQGLTFNVGAFHTYTTFSSRATRPDMVLLDTVEPWDSSPVTDVWSSPVPIWDGGWRDWDYDTKLAMQGDRLFSVSTRAFGWGDYPMNLMLREWHADTGWGTTSLLTALPNSAAAGYGVQGHRFQVRPDGFGVVLYADRPQTDPQEVKLLEVGLPFNSTTTTIVSAADRWGTIGDVAVDSQGVSHLVWMETDELGGVYELWYATHHTITGLSTPVRVSEPGETSVRTATVGVYGGGRVLVAYGVSGAGTPYGGVFLRKITDTVSDRVQVGATDNAYGPGLRSTWDMPEPNVIDLTWAEAYSWGSQLLHQELSWGSVGGSDTAAVTIQSNELAATFTLEGPVSGEFTLANGEWTGPALPAGLYTITWHAIDGLGTPPPQVFEVTGDGAVIVSASYINENLHRVVTLTSPVGAGAISMFPAGTALLGGDTAHDTGTVTFRASPVEGQGFARWRADNGLGVSYHISNPLLLTIDRDTEVTAEFGPAGPFHVDTTLYGDGTITPGAVLPSGSRFVCTIAPAAGTTLQEVLLDGVPQALGTEVVIESVSGQHSIQAFTDTGRNKITATWLPEDGGIVTLNPTTYGLGDTVAVTAEPAAGYRFVEWRRDASGTNPAVDVLVDGSKAVEAIFAPEGVILGDLNDDGAISIEDAVIARRMYAGAVPVDLVHGDMDQNGRLDTADIAAILQAEARGDRPCLGGQQVGPDAAKRLVGFTNGIGLTLPGGWPDSSRRASVARGLADELPPLPPSLEGVTPIYDIRLAGTAAFGRDIGFQIPVPDSSRRSGDTLRMLFLDPELGDWVTLPTRVATSRAGTTAYGSGRRSGKYLVAKVSGTKNVVQGTHCVVYYDPSITHKLGGATVAAADFAAVVADKFDAVYQGYQGAGYDVPTYTKSSVDLFLTSMDLDRRADIYLSDASNTYSEPFYAWKTKNFYIPATFDDADDVLFNMAHELFHAIQNRKFSGLSMAANRWLFEMTAEYASRKAPHSRSLSTDYGLYLATPLGTLDEIHEYSSAHLTKYLLDQTGDTFETLWGTKLATSYAPYSALNSYAKSKAGMSLTRVHAHYLTAMMFDSSYADLIAEELTMPINGTPWGAGNVIDSTFSIPDDEAAGWMRTRLPAFPSYPAKVLVEVLDDVPAHVNAKVFNAPWRDPKQPGGRTPLGSFFSGESLPFVSTSLGDQDSVYVTGYNYFGWTAKSLRVRVRPLVVNVTQTPDPLPSGVECTFVGTVAPIPDCAQQLKVYWKLSDGTPWQIETVPASTPEFELKHTFKAEKDETFEVTFEVYCLDAGGRRRLLVKHTQGVAVGGRPAIVLTPNVQQVEINQLVTLTAQVQNTPDTPEYQWTFGDGSSAATTSQPTTTHTYTAVQEDGYAVTVKMADAGEPAVALAEAKGQVVVLDPVQVVDDPPTGNDPDAPTLDYSKLQRVDETRFWDGVREVYFKDGAGRKHGLYQSFLQNGAAQQPLEAGMYIHGKTEGQWQIHMQDGSGVIENRHFHRGLWVGVNAQARTVTMMAKSTVWPDRAVTEVYLYGGGLKAQDWPSVVAGSSCVLYYGDGTYETVTFDASGRRHGLCTLQYNVNAEVRTIYSGTFNAGVKTGFWKYLEWSGDTATGVTYDHRKDPPNQ